MSTDLIKLAEKCGMWSGSATKPRTGEKVYFATAASLQAFASALSEQEGKPSDEYSNFTQAAIDVLWNAQRFPVADMKIFEARLRAPSKGAPSPTQARASDAEDAWISVEERFPEREISVIGFWTPRDGKVHAGCYSTVCLNQYGVWVNPEDDEDEYAQPTFWLPLPKAPPAALQVATPASKEAGK